MLQLHHLTIPYPFSFASLDTLGNEIAESPWLTDTTTTVAGADDTCPDDVVALQWEYDDERGRMYVTLPDDQ